MKQIARFYTLCILLSLIGFMNVQAQKLPKIKGNRIVAPYNAP